MASSYFGFDVELLFFNPGIKSMNKLKRYLNKWKKEIGENRMTFTELVMKQSLVKLFSNLS